MKKILLMALLLVPLFSAFAQEPDRFSVKDGVILWQRVYQSPLDSAAVAAALVASGQVADIVGVKGGVACRILPRSVDYRGAGFKRGATAMFLLNGQLEAHATILVREGRYRVTVDRMVFGSTTETYLSRVGEKTTLEEYVLNRKGEIKDGFYSMNAAPIIDYDLSKLFDLSPKEEDDNW